MAWSRCGSRAALLALLALAMALALALAQQDVPVNLYKQCVMDNNHIGYCVQDSMCFENLTINTGAEIIDPNLRMLDVPPIPESECGDMLWCCELETDTPTPRPETTPAPGPGTTPAPGPGTTPAPGPGTTPAPGPGTTPAPGPGTTPAPGPGTTPAPGSGTTPAPGPGTTPAPGPGTTPAPGPGTTPVPGPGTTPGLNTSTCRLYYSECTWCAALYRPGGDVVVGHRLESGLFCAGVLLAPRVLLTSGTCVRTVGLEKVWALVPAAADPGHHYNVVEKIVHPEYKSGSRQNDIGLFVLGEDVQWTRDHGVACVGADNLNTTNCVVVGFDNREGITTTEMSVSDGDCPGRRWPRQQPDIACGLSTEEECDVKPGGAVFCQNLSDGQGGLDIVGVARTTCRQTTRSAVLTKLQPHKGWLQGQLQRLGAPLLHYVR